jgi:hypothetical protein
MMLNEGNATCSLNTSNHIFHVALVDLLGYPERNYVRSFTSSQELIDWIEINGNGHRVVAVRRGNLGEELPAAAGNPSADYQDIYTLANGDIEVGRVVVWDTLGLRYPRTRLPVGSG